MAATRTTKEVHVIATYYHKRDGKLTGVVTYLVRASNGVDSYCTTLIDGKASGCSCPARGSKCYHRVQLEQKAATRKEIASQLKAKTAPTWLVQLVDRGTLVAPRQVVQLEGIAPINGTLRVKGPAIENVPLNGAQQSAGLLLELPSRKALAS